jgi:hypothetical protein
MIMRQITRAWRELLIKSGHLALRLQLTNQTAGAFRLYLNHNSRCRQRRLSESERLQPTLVRKPEAGPHRSHLLQTQYVSICYPLIIHTSAYRRGRLSVNKYDLASSMINRFSGYCISRPGHHRAYLHKVLFTSGIVAAVRLS